MLKKRVQCEMFTLPSPSQPNQRCSVILPAVVNPTILARLADKPSFPQTRGSQIRQQLHEMEGVDTYACWIFLGELLFYRIRISLLKMINRFI